MESKAVVKPMSFSRSLLFFGIPAVVMILMFWRVMRIVDYLGIRLFFTFLIGMGLPVVGLFLYSIRFYRKERNPWCWEAFRQRFRLKRLDGRAWLWTVGLAVFMYTSGLLLEFTRNWMNEAVIAFPKILVRIFDPDPNYFMEVPLPGNWWILIGMLAFYLFNVLGEEFWWRGYILPRQELAMGPRTWWIHGLLWNLFHVFWPWELFRLLPASLALPFVAQKLKNTVPGMIAHFAINVPGLIAITQAILARD